MQQICGWKNYQEVIVTNSSHLPIRVPGIHLIQLLLEDAEVQLPRLRGEDGRVLDASIDGGVILVLLFKLGEELINLCLSLEEDAADRLHLVLLLKGLV